MLGGMPSYCLLYVKLIRNQIFYILKLNAHFTRHILTALSSIRYLQGCKNKKIGECARSAADNEKDGRYIFSI